MQFEKCVLKQKQHKIITKGQYKNANRRECQMSYVASSSISIIRGYNNDRKISRWQWLKEQIAAESDGKA